MSNCRVIWITIDMAINWATKFACDIIELTGVVCGHFTQANSKYMCLYYGQLIWKYILIYVLDYVVNRECSKKSDLCYQYHAGSDR